jgi:hypothetical protein
VLKIEQEASFEKAKQLLNEVTTHTLANAAFKSVFIQVDVDPL